MNPLECALGAPVVTQSSKLLVIGDPEGVNFRWLNERGWNVEQASLGHILKNFIPSRNSWDVVVATVGIQRLYATSSGAALEEFVVWLKNRSKLCLITPEHQILDPARNSLGPYVMPACFSKFSYSSEMIPADGEDDLGPVVALSDHVLFDGAIWHTAQQLTSLSAPPDSTETPEQRAKRPRTFLSKSGRIIKTQWGSSEYFEPVEVLREADVISRQIKANPDVRLFPDLHQVVRGRSVATVVRDGVPGDPIVGPEGVDRSVKPLLLMEHVIEVARSFAELGLFPNDFRPWNLLTSRGGLTLIDFADLSSIDQDSRELPQIIALGGTLIFLGGLHSGGLPLRLGSSFDTDLMEICDGWSKSRGVDLESLYDTPWHRLADPGRTFSFVADMTANDLLDEVVLGAQVGEG